MLNWLLDKLGFCARGQTDQPIQPQIGGPAANDQVRRQLLNHGDDGTQIRNVIHFFYPVTVGFGAPDAMIKAAFAQDGAQFSNAQTGSGLVLEMQREVASDTFDALTEGYAKVSGEMGWRYDGWECAAFAKD